MSDENHIHALRTKHQQMDARLRQELKRPVPDARIVSELKKQKLACKDSLQDYEARTIKKRCQPIEAEILEFPTVTAKEEASLMDIPYLGWQRMPEPQQMGIQFNRRR